MLFWFYFTNIQTKRVDVKKQPSIFHDIISTCTYGISPIIAIATVGRLTPVMADRVINNSEFEEDNGFYDKKSKDEDEPEKNE